MYPFYTAVKLGLELLHRRIRMTFTVSWYLFTALANQLPALHCSEAYQGRDTTGPDFGGAPDAALQSPFCYKPRKYYKTLFLGLFDMGVANTFIVFRHHKKMNLRTFNKCSPRYHDFFDTLWEQLLAVDSRLQRPVKECQSPRCERLQQKPPPVAATSEHLDIDLKRIWIYKYFCNVARGRDKTWFSIWHGDWSNGKDIRALLNKHNLCDCPPVECIIGHCFSFCNVVQNF
ncbi:hypothetical protein PHMEG_00032285 [Phytophthora megakarya]|uniref:PiggyBac transposable element-derived protein domain-containing protein n=1 Tax=Phytophthora megakarya TaxID=4795 RepID=A0A225UYG6_9STRA|nr:hypothetical protein PHMEG_00032285 [Phytophthora megakarya]